MPRQKLKTNETEKVPASELSMPGFPDAPVPDNDDDDNAAQPPSAVAPEADSTTSAVQAEIAKRARKPRRPRSDRGKSRSIGERGMEEERTDSQLSPEQLTEMATAFGKLAANTTAALTLYVAEKYGDKWVMRPEESANFEIAFQMLARKHAATLAENPEAYFFGVALLGYVTPRLIDNEKASGSVGQDFSYADRLQ